VAYWEAAGKERLARDKTFDRSVLDHLVRSGLALAMAEVSKSGATGIHEVSVQASLSGFVVSGMFFGDAGYRFRYEKIYDLFELGSWSPWVGFWNRYVVKRMGMSAYAEAFVERAWKDIAARESYYVMQGKINPPQGWIALEEKTALAEVAGPGSEPARISRSL
jgi:hypothetical protein